MKEDFIKAAREVGRWVAPVIQKAIPLALTLTVSANAFAGTFINNDVMDFSPGTQQAIEAVASKTIITYEPEKTAQKSARALHKELRRASSILNKEEAKEIKDAALDQYLSHVTIFAPDGISKKAAMDEIKRRILIIPTAINPLKNSDYPIFATPPTQNMAGTVIAHIKAMPQQERTNLVRTLGFMGVENTLSDDIKDDLVLYTILHETAHASDETFFSQDSETPFKDSIMAEQHARLRHEIHADVTACKELYKIRGNMDCIRLLALMRAQDLGDPTHQTASAITAWANEIQPGTIDLPGTLSPEEIIKIHHIKFDGGVSFNDLARLVVMATDQPSGPSYGPFAQKFEIDVTGIATDLPGISPEERTLIKKRLEIFTAGKKGIEDFRTSASQKPEGPVTAGAKPPVLTP